MLDHHGDAEIADGLVDLAVNVSPTPSWLRLDGLDLAAYPRPGRAVAAVAERHGVSRNQVLLTNGAAEAFVLIARTFRPKHPVVVHPQFTEPENALLAAGHRIDRVILTGDFSLRPDLVPPDADLVIVGNPTNPTGVLHPASAIRALHRPGRIVVVDEAFADSVPGEPESLVGAEGTLVVRSLTKTFGLAGLRAGYVIGDVAPLRTVQQLWPVSTLALAAIEQCMSERGRAYGTERAAEIAADRSYLEAGLRAAGAELPARSRASFVLVRLPNADKVRLRLRKLGFAVRRGDTFPGLGPDYLRIAVRPRPVTDRFLEALRIALAAPTPAIADVVGAAAFVEQPRRALRRILVLGGSGSGKSEFAERLLAQRPAVYLAPGEPAGADQEWAERIRRHQQRRPPHWRTEETTDLAGHLRMGGDPLLIDCLSTWLARIMDCHGYWTGGSISEELDKVEDAWRASGRDVVAVSSEVGLGVVPETSAGRRYRDELGRLNQRIAAASDEVWLVIAGIPTRIR